jgi:hypothetical protein
MVEGEPERRLKIAYEEYVCEVGGMDDKINLAEKLALLDGPFQPGIVGFMNDYKTSSSVNTGHAGGELTEPERVI